MDIEGIRLTDDELIRVIPAKHRHIANTATDKAIKRIYEWLELGAVHGDDGVVRFHPWKWEALKKLVNNNV